MLSMIATFNSLFYHLTAVDFTDLQAKPKLTQRPYCYDNSEKETKQNRNRESQAKHYSPVNIFIHNCSR